MSANCGEIGTAVAPGRDSEPARACLTPDRSLPYLTPAGWVAERFKAPVLKTGVGATPP
jgi:hypothetical protein